MRKPVVLITGASGEIGHGMISRLGENKDHAVISLDLRPLPEELSSRVQQHIVGSILDVQLLDRILAEYEIDRIYHLAAILSTRAEFAPVSAHRINVEGMINLLEFAQKQGESHGRPVLFLYPSSIAVYGLPSLEVKNQAGRVKEDEHTAPVTMYGANKLYCEHLGRYYARHYKQLAAETLSGKVDFRCLRFPGLISAYTMPSGGTSDYASEMIHAAAQDSAYACFVRPDTRIPFMTMPDGVEALLRLATALRPQLTRTVYNVSAFSPSAADIQGIVAKAFPRAHLTTQVDRKRQGILDSWPAAVDDDAARRDWGFAPRYNLDQAFRDYLIPTIRTRYQ